MNPGVAGPDATNEQCKATFELDGPLGADLHLNKQMAMAGPRKNKEFVMRFIRELSGIRKDRQHIERFVADEQLIQHLLFFDQVFPANEMLVDELTAEGDRVICRARMKGIHGGAINGIPATGKAIDFPMVFGCEVERERIVNHWMIADQAGLLEQLGIANEKNH